MGFKHNDSCLAKAADDEPIFVLRAKDKVAPSIVRAWIHCAILAGAAGPKIDEAYALADAMEAWQKKNGCKTPD